MMAYSNLSDDGVLSGIQILFSLVNFKKNTHKKTKTKKNNSDRVGPQLTKLSGSAHGYIPLTLVK